MNCPRCKKSNPDMMYEINRNICCCPDCITSEEERTLENIRRKAWNLPLIPPNLDAYVETEK